MTICTTPDCGQEANLYICNEHIKELQTELGKVPELLEDLFITMAKLDNTAPQRSEGGGGLTTTSKLPIRPRAMELRQALGIWTHCDAKALAKDHRVANFLPMIKKLIDDANTCIDNPPEQRVITTCNCGGKVITLEPKPEDGKPDTGNCEACGEYYEQTEAMTRFRIHRETPQDLTTRQALKWIRDNAGLSIKAEDIRNWAREGKLNSTNPERGKYDHPTYNVADVLTVHYRHVEKGKRVTSF